MNVQHFAYSNLADRKSYHIGFYGKCLAEKGAFMVSVWTHHDARQFLGFVDYEDLAPEEKVWAVRFLGVPNF